MRFHYGLSYSWTFLAKYGANVAIPIVMAWAGNYLAARSSETAAEKRLWQGLFIALTLLWLGGSFWVLSTEDEQHRREMADLKHEVKGDVTAAIIDYNNDHPQHQITSEQFAAFTKSLNDRKNAVAPLSSPVIPASMREQAQGSPATPPNQPLIRPVITSAPRINTNGVITGQHFGSIPQDVYLHIRVKPSAQVGDYGLVGKVGPDKLFGNLDPSNYIKTVGAIGRWSDNSIALAFPPGYWDRLFEAVTAEAHYRGLTPPQRSDLEAGYQVRRKDEDVVSEWFYAK
jgi:hypothetical protein